MCGTIGDGSAQAVGCRLQAAAGAGPREEEVRAPLTHSLTRMPTLMFTQLPTMSLTHTLSHSLRQETQRVILQKAIRLRSKREDSDKRNALKKYNNERAEYFYK